MTERHQEIWNRFCKNLVEKKEELQHRADLCNRLWKKDVELINWTSDLLLEDTVWFKLPWDMEQTAEPIHFEGGIDWSYVPEQDQEFTYQLNRHRIFICLGQSYLLTGEEKYAEKFTRLLMDWIAKEPWSESKANTTWRTLDTGLRVDYWIRAMALCAHSPAVTDEVIGAFLDSLEQQAQRLYTNTNTGFSMKSNWGVMEYTGLYFLSFLLQNKQYREASRKYLRGALQIQIMDDGMQWEASPMYHNEVLMGFMESMRIAEIFGDDLFTPVDKGIIEKMAMTTMHLMTPAHHQPMVGDSDDTDVRDLLSQAALLLDNGHLKSGGYPCLDFEGIWLFGTRGYKRYDNLNARANPAGITNLSSSGQVVLRNGWEEDSFWLYFKNGPLGGGHGHADKLQLSLWMDGDEILLDNGRYTYLDVPDRYTLKSSRYHNVPLVDGEEYAPSESSWMYQATPVSTPNYVCQKGAFTLINGAHTGYSKGKGVLTDRRVIALGTDAVVVCDSFIGPKAGSVSQMYHFAENIRLEQAEGVLLGQGEHGSFAVHSYSRGQSLQAELSRGMISRHYNHLNEGPVAELRAEDSDFIATFFLKGKGGTVRSVPVWNRMRNVELKAHEADGFIVDTGTKRYGVVVLHQDVGNQSDLNGLEGIYGMGRVMVCDLDGESQFMTVLQW